MTYVLGPSRLYIVNNLLVVMQWFYSEIHPFVLRFLIHRSVFEKDLKYEKDLIKYVCLKYVCFFENIFENE